MSKIDIAQLKKLRAETGAGYKDCKDALLAVNTLDEAKDWLRIKGVYKVERIAGRPTREGMVATYTHIGSKIATLVELNCETDFVALNKEFQTLAHDLAMHVAATNPIYITRAEVPPEDLEKEEAILRLELAAEKKPPEIVERVVTGRMAKFYERYCLLEQFFIKDDGRTVNEVLRDAVTKFGENIRIKRFTRYVVGEELS